MTGDELRAALQTHNLTQAGFAARLGVFEVTVNKWVNDRLPVPCYVALVIQLLDVIQQLEIERMKR